MLEIDCHLHSHHPSSQAGASPKSRNSDGRSATDLAEDKGRRELAQLLRRAALGAHEGVYKVILFNSAEAAIHPQKKTLNP